MEIKKDEKISLDELLADFKSKTEPRSSKLSKLDKYKKFITSLSNEKYSHQQICEYLKLVGVSVSISSVSRFIKRNQISTSFKDTSNDSIDHIQHKKYSEDIKNNEDSSNGKLISIPTGPSKKNFNYEPTHVRKKSGDKS